jgi:hypothetical protein
MATMTRLDIETFVRDYLGDRSDLSAVKIQASINRIYKQMGLAFQFHELEYEDTSITTVSGTESYSITAISPVPRAIVSFVDTTNRQQLERKDRFWLGRQDRSAGQEARPLYWARFGSKLYLNPIPDGAYNTELLYVGLPVDMASDSAEPVYPEEWHEVIALMTSMRWLFIYGLDMRAMNAKNEALGLVSGLVEDETIARKFAMMMGQIAVDRRGQNG